MTAVGNKHHYYTKVEVNKKASQHHAAQPPLTAFSSTSLSWSESSATTNKEDSTAKPDEAKGKKLLDVLERFSVALCLLPVGVRGTARSPQGILRAAVTVVVGVVLWSTWPGIMAVMFLPQTKPDKMSMMWIGEVLFLLSLALGSLITAVCFWFKSKRLSSLLDQYRLLLDGSISCRLSAAAGIFVLLPTLIYSGQFSVWYVDYMNSSSLWINILFSLSLSWLEFVLIIPVLYYTILGLLISEALTVNNTALSRAVLEEGKKTPLVKVQKQYLTLRRLYSELEDIISLPLFAFDFNTAYTLMNTIFFIILTYANNENQSYIPANLLSGVLTIGVILLMGHTADTITKKAAEPLTILIQAEIEGHTDTVPLSNWPRTPDQLLIIKIAEQPLNFSVGGFFNLGLSNILSMVSAAATYLVIWLQFDNGVIMRSY